MSKTARQAATGHRPSGRQCAECQRAADDCSRLDFAAMPPAGKRDPDGVQRVACSYYVRVERVSAADELCQESPEGCGNCHTCAPNRIGGPMRMIVCPECGNKRCPKANDCRNACTGSNEPGQPGSAYPAADSEHPCCGALASGPHKMGCDYKLVATKYSNEINELQQKPDDFVRASGNQIKPCRCGPDMCADSVACPRGVA